MVIKSSSPYLGTLQNHCKHLKGVINYLSRESDFPGFSVKCQQLPAMRVNSGKQKRIKTEQFTDPDPNPAVQYIEIYSFEVFLIKLLSLRYTIISILNFKCSF